MLDGKLYNCVNDGVEGLVVCIFCWIFVARPVGRGRIMCFVVLDRILWYCE